MTSESTARQRDVNRIIRGARASVVTPTVVQVQPVQYPQGTARSQTTPLGAPLTLNTNIAFPRGFLGMNRQCTDGAAPFLPPPLQVTQIIPSCLPAGTYRKICRHCGRVKSQHHHSKEFGMGKCKFTHCARCLMQHTGMGLACRAMPGPGVRAQELIAYDTSMKAILEK